MAQYDPAFTPLKKDKKEEQKEQKYDPAFTVLKPEDYALSGVEFEEKPLPEIKPDSPSLRFRGQALSDPNADWWEKLKGFGEVIDAMAGMSSRISGAEDVEKKIAEDIPKIPFVKQAMQDFASGLSFEGKEAPKEGEVGKRAWNELVGMGIGGLGETLEDPRSYILPKVFGELGKKTTWSAKDLEYWREIYEKSRKPIQGGRVEVVEPKRLMGTYDPEGVGPITGLAPRFPKKPSGGRFLASPSGVANIRSALPLAAGAQAGEFSPPLDPRDTSRFPRTIIEGTPNPPIPQGILNQEAPPPPPVPQAQGQYNPETDNPFDPNKFGPNAKAQILQENSLAETAGRPSQFDLTHPDNTPEKVEFLVNYLQSQDDPNFSHYPVPQPLTPEAPVTPRFKNVPRKSRFAPPEPPTSTTPVKPVFRVTADGQVIDLNTGETMDIETARRRLEEGLSRREADPDTLLESRTPKYALGEPRGWEPPGTTPKQVEDFLHQIARVMEDQYHRSFAQVNFTQMQSSLASALGKVRGKQGSSFAAKTGNDVGTAFHALDYAARLNIMRSYQAKIRGEKGRPRVGFDDDLQTSRPPREPLEFDPARKKIKDILAVTNLEIALDNINNTWMDLEYAKMNGDPDEIETMGRVYDFAREHYDNLSRGKGTKLDEIDFGSKNILKAEVPGEDAITIDADTEGAIQELTFNYSAPLPAIMKREMDQNAFDAAKLLGLDGEVTAIFNDNDHNGDAYIEVRDNGRGMTRAQIGDVYTTLFKSGKVGEGTATGGKGVGKATFMLGGKHFYMETVAFDPALNAKTKIIIDATPQELKGKYKPIKTIVDDSTPTGTMVRTTLKDDQKNRLYAARTMWDDTKKYSRFGPTPPKLKEVLYGYGDPRNKLNSLNRPKNTDWADSSQDTSLATKDFGHSTVELISIGSMGESKRGYIPMGVLNNGMFQYETSHDLDEEHTMPNNIIIDIRPKVSEKDQNYPFPVQREGIKQDFKNEIETWINDTLVYPRAKRSKAQIKELYDNMTSISAGFNTHRKVVMFDPGNRLTKGEAKVLANSNTIKNVVGISDSFLEAILQAVGNPDEIDKLEGVGIILSPGDIAGLHVPNIDSPVPKSTILLDLWARLKINPDMTPEDVARELTITLLHEYAHIGTETPAYEPLSQADLQDPRTAKFIDTLLKETAEQGGRDLGHGFGFIRRLGHAYAKVTVQKSLRYQDAFLDAISEPSTTDPNARQFTSEFQRLLQIYLDSRGRNATTEDYLSGTGVQQKITGRGRGSFEGSNKDGLTGSSSGLKPRGARSIWDETGAVNLGGPGGPPRYDSIPRRGTPPSEPSVQIDADIKDRMFGEGYLIPRAFGLVKGLVATGDLPPLLRQGGAYAGRKFWRQAAKQQFRSYASEGGHQRALAEIRAHELMQPQANGKTEAEEMGLDINAGRRGWGHQEEAMMGIEDAERLVGWMTRGKINPVKASNRAFHDTMDYLRLEAALQLKNNYRNYYDSFRRTIQTDGDRRYAASMNPASPVVKAKIGELVNSTSGRARFGLKERRTPKDIRIPGTTRWVNVPKPLADIPLWPDTPFERFAGVANLVLFSGRLAKSYVERYNRLLNPYSYMKADPVMRREYLKQLLSIGGARVVLTGLGAAFGGLLGTVATSSEWGKSVMPGGKVAMDTTLGGGKYETFAARVLQGEYTNRRGETKGLGEGPYVPTGLDLVEDLGEGLASPAFRAAIEVLRKSEHFSGPQAAGQELGLRTVIDTTTPIIGQDMWDIITESPEYIPLLYPDAIGVGLTIRSGEEIK